MSHVPTVILTNMWFTQKQEVDAHVVALICLSRFFGSTSASSGGDEIWVAVEEVGEEACQNKGF